MPECQPPVQVRSSISFPCRTARWNRRKKFCVVAAAISSVATSSSSASVRAVCGDQGGLVALAAIGGGREPGRVGFDQDAVERQAGGHVAQGLRLGVGEVAGKGDEEAEVERAPRLLPPAAEAVHDAAQAGVAPVVVQNQEEIVPGVGGSVFRRGSG